MSDDIQQSPFSATLRVLLGLMGAGSFGAGVLAVFTTENGTGTGVLLIVGSILLVVALLGNRIESLEFGGARLKLRAAAAERFALAEESARRGDDDAADRLRAEAQALLDAASPLAAEYRSVRGSMRAGPERTRLMSGIVARARRVATEQSFEPEEVLRWFHEGSEEKRITALGMMQAEPRLRSFEAALEGIEHSRSAFEQFHAMALASQMLDDLDETQRRRLVEAVESQGSRRFRNDSSRWELGEQILRRAAEHSDTGGG